MPSSPYPIVFYYGSGSPAGWRVWLSLEYKGLSYDLRTLSFSAGDTKDPGFIALNPRGRVPTIVDQAFPLSESSAIMEYLDEQYADRPKLFHGNIQERAHIRRWVADIDDNLQKHVGAISRILFGGPAEGWDTDKIAEGKKKLVEELAYIAKNMNTTWVAGSELSAADFTLYPAYAMLARLDMKKPDLGLSTQAPAVLQEWANRIRALPYFSKTIPPHWKT